MRGLPGGGGVSSEGRGFIAVPVACSVAVCPRSCRGFCPRSCPRFCRDSCPRFCPRSCPRFCRGSCPRSCPRSCRGLCRDGAGVAPVPPRFARGSEPAAAAGAAPLRAGGGRGAGLGRHPRHGGAGRPGHRPAGLPQPGRGAGGGRGPPGGSGGARGVRGQRLGVLLSARPTAANLGTEAERLRAWLRRKVRESPGVTPQELRESIIEYIEGLLAKDRRDNRSIGAHGAQHILAGVPGGGPVTLLTHCNTGTLATAGYGTALGVVRALHERGSLSRVFCTETRPFHQGSRLSALELRHDGIPVTLIADSAAAAAMREHGVHAVVVGADRVAANGDVANKIGTFQLALAARHLRVPFYVAAPSSSCDPSLASGSLIPIEERPGTELTQLGGVLLAEPEVDVWNPAFDVTPHELITGGIITEWGVFPPSQLSRELAERGER